jgi:hypothetical protein
MPEENRQVMPADAVHDRMMQMINGTSYADKDRFGYMSRKRAGNTVDLFKAAFKEPMRAEQLYSAELKKSVTLATGLTYYDLRAPALNLFPTVTPLRNSLPRNQRPNPGDAAHWKSVDAITGSGFPYMGWVPEGKRSASMSYTTNDHTLSYQTMGEEDSITEEARFAAQGFEDEDALVQLRLLLKMFVKEEAGLLAGNHGTTLSTPATPTLSAAGSGATLPAATYSVIVVALTPEGYLNSSLSGGVAVALTITGNDGGTYTLNGGSSAQSTNATQAVTLGQTLSANTNTQPGAVAYAWYVGTAGSETLQAITTINSATFAATLAGGRQAATAVTGDHSKNATAFDGLLITTFAASNSYLNALATGTPGTGTVLTSSGQGSINEIDTMNKTMWDTNRISNTVMYVNSQELKNIAAKVLNGASAPLLRYATDATDGGVPEYKITASGVISFYYNPYTPDGGVKMPIKVHPNMPAGTILGRAEILPPWYVSNNVPEVAVVQTRQDYYAEVWPKTTRVQFYGVYSQEVLAVYATFAAGIIYNIGNG